MSDVAVDDLTELLPALLQALEALAFVSRHLKPLQMDETLAAVGAPDDALRSAREKLRPWPEHLAGLRARIEAASDAALESFDGLRAAGNEPEGLRSVFRALKRVARAHDALYPLAAGLPPVSRFFLEPEARDDVDVHARLATQSGAGGVAHFGERPGARGGFSLYAPEYCDASRALPLVVALHGGSGDGFSFLWNWLPAVRAHGAILVAPTSLGRTWALMGEDVDTPNIMRIVDFVRERFNVDASRMLLTGMSDGGTFCYVSGLVPESKFTHLAPVSASFHPLLAEMADPARLRELPIMVTHGRLDWMFPVDMARQAQRALSAAGARVEYREIADLSHCYPREANAGILNWVGGTADLRN